MDLAEQGCLSDGLNNVLERLHDCSDQDYSALVTGLEKLNHEVCTDDASLQAFHKANGLKILEKRLEHESERPLCGDQNTETLDTFQLSRQEFVLCSVFFLNRTIRWSCFRHELYRIWDPVKMESCLSRFYSDDENERQFGFLLSAALDDRTIFTAFDLGKGNLDDLSRSLKTQRGSTAIPDIFNPELFVALLAKTIACPDSCDDDEIKTRIMARLTSLTNLLISKGAENNAIMASNAGATEAVLECLICYATSEKRELGQNLTELAYGLVPYGLSRRSCSMLMGLVQDRFFLGKSYLAIMDDFLRTAMRQKSLRQILFRQNGHYGDSIRFPVLPKKGLFPNGPAGYTFMSWINIVTLHPNKPTTIIASRNPTGDIPYMLYFEPNTSRLVLQIGRDSRVQFRTAYFADCKDWTHITIVHKKAVGSNAAKATLYLNGSSYESLRCPYPVRAAVGVDANNSVIIGALDEEGGSDETPYPAMFSLASLYLIDSVLDPDRIQIIHKLGPEYFGGFQECLGNLLTYEGSAYLNEQFEKIAAGDRAKSALTRIQSKNTPIVNESDISLLVTPMSVLEREYSNKSWLSQVAIGNFNTVVGNASGSVCANSCFSSSDTALSDTKYIGQMSGNFCIKQSCSSLADQVWFTGGPAILLYLLSLASDTSQLTLALDLLLHSFRHSWRSSEEMERINGYDILSNLLMDKKDLIDTDILRSIFHHTGIDLKDARINNLLLYRCVLLKFNLWLSSDNTELHALYMSHFRLVYVESDAAAFNVKRLSKMHSVKKLLFLFKSGRYTKFLLENFQDALRIILEVNCTQENLRAAATFVIFALYKIENKSRRLEKNIETTLETADVYHQQAKPLNDIRGAGVKVLRLLCSLLGQSDTFYATKFATTITWKWTLILILNKDPEVVYYALDILAVLFRTQGPTYIAKFSHAKVQAFSVLESQASTWWKIPRLWPLLFQLLLNKPVAADALQSGFSASQLLRAFSVGNGESSDNDIVEGIFPTIMEMIKMGLCYLADEGFYGDESNDVFSVVQSFSMPNDADLQSTTDWTVSDNQTLMGIITNVVYFIMRLQDTDKAFKRFSCEQQFQRILFQVLFPVVCVGGVVSIQTELRYKGLGAAMEHNEDVKIHNRASSKGRPQILRSASKSSQGQKRPGRGRAPSLHREDSYVLVDDQLGEEPPHDAERMRFQLPIISSETPILRVSHSVIQMVVELFRNSTLERIIGTTNQSGVPIHALLPPSYQAHQIYFETFILKNVLASLKTHLLSNQDILLEPQKLSRIHELCEQACESVFEGWFLSGSEFVIDVIGTVLEYVSDEQVQNLQSIKLSQAIIQNFRVMFYRMLLFRFSEVWESAQDTLQTEKLLAKLVYWQKVLSTEYNGPEVLFRLIMYHLCSVMLDSNPQLQRTSIDAFRLFILHKSEELKKLVSKAKLNDHEKEACLETLFRVLETDTGEFVLVLRENDKVLQRLVVLSLRTEWNKFINEENRSSRQKLTQRANLRVESLNKTLDQEKARSEILSEDSKTFAKIATEIEDVDRLQVIKTLHDEKDHDHFVNENWNKEVNRILCHCNFFERQTGYQWMLDVTEGRSRMRKKLRKQYVPSLRQPSKMGSKTSSSPSDYSVELHHQSQVRNFGSESTGTAASDDESEVTKEKLVDIEDDGKRKVARCMERGDTLEDGFNVGRIVGLQAIEGIALVGRKNIYLIDNYFQVNFSNTVEILNIWDTAVTKLRNKYLKYLSGRVDNHDDLPAMSLNGQDSHECHKWAFEAVVSFSKRQFLFQDVALEIFFNDGQSHLLILHSHEDRNSLFNKLSNKCHRLSKSGMASGADIFTGDELISQSRRLGLKFTKMLSGAPDNPYFKDWQERKMSNFEYIMKLNTMAGRTYNDLTQYPVFPWVLSNYSGDTLELDNSNNYRNLQKPMGAQVESREQYFQERYNTFAELNDQAQPPFHYGTHYSSAMITCSFLVRLPPFVNAYLSLQGGKFDHADRLFYSIEQAWTSAALKNMSDVRELTPEFFYSREFLLNRNGYDFGKRQNNQVVSDVELPAWSMGDELYFVDKNREALESEYVSQNLHYWIDLVFGYRQRGPDAISSANVFHHLSYGGSIDLEQISDPVQLAATVGIIHNFGQTPKQIFKRPHPVRKADFSANIDNGIESLGRFEEHVRYVLQSYKPAKSIRHPVGSILYESRSDSMALLPQGLLRLPISDLFIRADRLLGSVRFESIASNTYTVYQHLQPGRIVDLKLCGSRILVIGSEEGAIGVWAIDTRHQTLTLKDFLRGHSSCLCAIEVSESFNIIVSVSEDGILNLWDLNRLELDHSLNVGPCKHFSLSINATNGDVMVYKRCRGHLYTLNGGLLLEQDMGDDPDDIISCSTFYEGAYSEYLRKTILLTGHRRGIVKIWEQSAKAESDKIERSFQLVRQLQIYDREGKFLDSPVTSILVHGYARIIFAGTEAGNCFTFALPDSRTTVHHSNIDKASHCMQCGHKFSIMERRLNCKACGRVVSADKLKDYRGYFGMALCKFCTKTISDMKHP